MSWRFDMPELIDHVGYLDRSLAAIKLPIKVKYDVYDQGRLAAWDISRPITDQFLGRYREHDRHIYDKDGKRAYLALRTQLLNGQQ